MKIKLPEILIIALPRRFTGEEIVQIELDILKTCSFKLQSKTILDSSYAKLYKMINKKSSYYFDDVEITLMSTHIEFLS